MDHSSSISIIIIFFTLKFHYTILSTYLKKMHSDLIHVLTFEFLSGVAQIIRDKYEQLVAPHSGRISRRTSSLLE